MNVTWGFEHLHRTFLFQAVLLLSPPYSSTFFYPHVWFPPSVSIVTPPHLYELTMVFDRRSLGISSIGVRFGACPVVIPASFHIASPECRRALTTPVYTFQAHGLNRPILSIHPRARRNFFKLQFVSWKLTMTWRADVTRKAWRNQWAISRLPPQGYTLQYLIVPVGTPRAFLFINHFLS